jgi:hypothetical protein
VFTARYALIPYVKQISFVFKGLNCAGAWPRSNSNAPAHAELLPRSWNYLVFFVNIFIMHITKNNF